MNNQAMKTQNEEFVQENKIWCIGWCLVNAVDFVALLSVFAVFVLLGIYHDPHCLLAAAGITAGSSARHLLILYSDAIKDGMRKFGPLFKLQAFFDESCIFSAKSIKILSALSDKKLLKIDELNRILKSLSYLSLNIVHSCLTPRITPTPQTAC